MTGCATLPSPDLDRARATYAEVANSDDAAMSASVELYEAEKTLRRAEQARQARKAPEEVSHLAYIAERRVQIAKASAREKAANARVEELSSQRGEVLLLARTREGQRALAAAARERRRAEELERALVELKARETVRGLVLTLGDVLFDFGEAELRAGAQGNLDHVISFLADHLGRDVLIEGFTDNSGPQKYNLSLSRRRAEAVRSRLVARGVSPGRLVTRGYGEEHPILSNATPEGRQRNRRVEIIILPPGELAATRTRRSERPAVGSGPTTR